MKTFQAAALAVACLYPSAGAAGERLVEEGFFAGEISANVGIVSDYVFRGYSQTDEGPAVQGGFDYTFDNGLYIGTWASNVNFNDGDEATVEIDAYGGFANSIDIFSYDVGYVYYFYPGASTALDYDFGELYANVGLDLTYFEINGGVYYSPEFFGAAGDAVYTYAGASVPVPDGWLPIPVSFDAKIGHQDIENGSDYNDWSVGVTAEALTLEFRVEYTDTDVKNDDLADGRVVFGVSKSF